MKIQAIQNIQYNYPRFQPANSNPKESQNTVTDRSLNFMALPDLVKKRLRLGTEIKTLDEYVDTMNKIYGYKTADGKPLFDRVANISGYKKVKKDEEGILLYAGDEDLSGDINRFLSGREMREMNPVQARNVIRALDYSLKCLDKRYGKYSGIVYRQGYFPVTEKQYVSTTTDPVLAATLWGGICYDKNLQFSIVNVKNGHKIRDFQRRIGSEFAEDEEEILAPRTSSFREVLNPVGEVYLKKRVFHKLLEKYAHKEINPANIKVYEEI